MMKTINNVTSISDRKEKLKLEVVASDLETVMYLLRLIKSGLSEYSIYVPIRNIYITIVENERLLAQHLEKINEKLGKIHESKE